MLRLLGLKTPNDVELGTLTGVTALLKPFEWPVSWNVGRNKIKILVFGKLTDSWRDVITYVSTDKHLSNKLYGKKFFVSFCLSNLNWIELRLNDDRFLRLHFLYKFLWLFVLGAIIWAWFWHEMYFCASRWCWFWFSWLRSDMKQGKKIVSVPQQW